MAHCSGVVYRGMWINGHPVARAARMVILGPETMHVAAGSSFPVRVQLQQEDGAVAESEHGRVLRVSAGVRYVQLPAYSEVCFFCMDEDRREAPIQTPFPSPGSLEPGATPESARDLEGALISDALHGQGDTPAGLPGGRSACCLEDCRRVERGRAEFLHVRLGPSPPGYHPIPFLDAVREKASSRPWRDLGPRTGTPTVQDPPGDRRPDGVTGAAPGTAAFPGEYVIMVQDVTTPPFLGRTLPTAFQHLRVSAKGSGRQSPIPGEGPKAQN